MPGDKSWLLVEGPDDKHFVFHLCNLPPPIDNKALFEVKSAEGSERLRKLLRTTVKTAAPAVGAIVDADGDPAARWESLRSAVAEVFPEVPPEPQADGWVGEGVTGARLGLWMMPDNRNPGMLETFVTSLIPPDDALLPLAHQAVADIPPEHRRFGTAEAKARLYTWLAWQEEPGVTPALAVTKRYVAHEHRRIEALREWIRRLYSPPEARSSHSA